MCYSEIEKFACGHEDKHKIPCEAFCDNGSCSKPEADQVRDDAGPKCNKCKEDDDEMDFIQEELRKFAEQESLNPSAASAARPRDPNAPKHYFKRCIVWSRCGHHSHPRPSDIERDQSDPEYLHVEGLGNCFDCSAAPASTIAKMKQNGDYEKEDPWGAMSRAEVGEGSSRAVALPSLEEIGQGVTQEQVKEHNGRDTSVSLPPSPERDDSRSQPAPSWGTDYDFSPIKGKGRAGMPMHPLAQSVSAENIESDEEDELHHKNTKSGKHFDAHEESTDEEDYEEGEGEVEEDDEDDEGGEEDHHQLHGSGKQAGHHSLVSDGELDEAHFSGDEGAHGEAVYRGRDKHRAHSDDENDDFDHLSNANASEAYSDEENELATPKSQMKKTHAKG